MVETTNDFFDNLDNFSSSVISNGVGFVLAPKLFLGVIIISTISEVYKLINPAIRILPEIRREKNRLLGDQNMTPEERTNAERQFRDIRSEIRLKGITDVIISLPSFAINIAILAVYLVLGIALMAPLLPVGLFVISAGLITKGVARIAQKIRGSNPITLAEPDIIQERIVPENFARQTSNDSVHSIDRSESFCIVSSEQFYEPDAEEALISPDFPGVRNSQSPSTTFVDQARRSKEKERQQSKGRKVHFTKNVK